MLKAMCIGIGVFLILLGISLHSIDSYTVKPSVTAKATGLWYGPLQPEAKTVTPEPSITAAGVGASITGAHFDYIWTDDIETIEDRYSAAAREWAKAYFRELDNLIDPLGQTRLSGTPWHEQAVFSTIDEKFFADRRFPVGTVPLPEEELAETIVFCDNYGQTGAVNYYNRGKMAEAYSFNTDYINWLPRKEKITNILLIGEEPGIEIINLFKACKAIGEVTNPYAREKGTKIILLTGAKPEFTGLFYQMAEKRKKTFDIF